MLASSNATPAKIPSKPRHQTRLTERLRDDRVHGLRHRDRQTGIHFRQRGLHELRHRIHFQIAADGDVNEWKVFLRPRPIKFHTRRLGHSDRAHIADDSDNFARHTRLDEQSLSDWILARINFFRTGLTDQTNLLSVGGVVLIELAAGQKRHSPGLEISGRNVVTRRDRAFLDWRNIAIAARIKSATAASQRNIAADGRALETGNIAQLMRAFVRQNVDATEGRDTARSAA